MIMARLISFVFIYKFNLITIFNAYCIIFRTRPVHTPKNVSIKVSTNYDSHFPYAIYSPGPCKWAKLKKSLTNEKTAMGVVPFFHSTANEYWYYVRKNWKKKSKRKSPSQFRNIIISQMRNSLNNTRRPFRWAPIMDLEGGPWMVNFDRWLVFRAYYPVRPSLSQEFEAFLLIKTSFSLSLSFSSLRMWYAKRKKRGRSLFAVSVHFLPFYLFMMKFFFLY